MSSSLFVRQSLSSRASARLGSTRLASTGRSPLNAGPSSVEVSL
jgi:hypothetical protein